MLKNEHFVLLCRTHRLQISFMMPLGARSKASPVHYCTVEVTHTYTYLCTCTLDFSDATLAGQCYITLSASNEAQLMLMYCVATTLTQLATRSTSTLKTRTESDRWGEMATLEGSGDVNLCRRIFCVLTIGWFSRMYYFSALIGFCCKNTKQFKSFFHFLYNYGEVILE